MWVKKLNKISQNSVTEILRDFMLKKQHMDNFQFGGEYNLNVRVFSNDKSVIFSEIWG